MYISLWLIAETNATKDCKDHDKKEPRLCEAIPICVLHYKPCKAVRLKIYIYFFFLHSNSPIYPVGQIGPRWS